MRRAEVTVLTILYVIASFLVSIYTEKELKLVDKIESSFDTNTTKKYKKIIIE